MKILIISICLVFNACQKETTKELTVAEYFDQTGRDDIATGGIKMIPIQTEKGTFKVWTKRIGNNPKIKILLLHGGPGVTHELYEVFDSYFPRKGFEYYYYDQLGSYYSDQPDDLDLWKIDRFVEEVEQVRKALKLDKSNFYLLGQSWGGMLAMQYALKYQANLKGLIISNMVPSVPEYNRYAEEVLGPQLDPDVLKEIKAFEAQKDYENPRYMELLMSHYYTEHILRKPLDEWPEAINRTFKHLNPKVYITMQGPSEFGITGDANLKDWDVTDQLKNISVPTLSIGARHDTMDPAKMKLIAESVQRGRFLLCPNGSHLSQYDDPEHYLPGVIKFINDVNSGDF